MAYGRTPVESPLVWNFCPLSHKETSCPGGVPLEGGWADEGPRTGSLAVAHGDTNCPAKKKITDQWGMVMPKIGCDETRDPFSRKIDIGNMDGLDR